MKDILENGKNIGRIYNLFSSVCKKGAYRCISGSNVSTKFTDSAPEAQEHCKQMGGTIWTPRGNLSDTLFEESNTVWTGSVRYNRTHLLREDGIIFEPMPSYLEDTPAIVVAKLANEKITMTNHEQLDGDIVNRCLCVNHQKASLFLATAFTMILVLIIICAFVIFTQCYPYDLFKIRLSDPKIVSTGYSSLVI